ncbi:MAG: hypothetical protein R3F35_13390 [Myxococcota bacterium]
MERAQPNRDPHPPTDPPVDEPIEPKLALLRRPETYREGASRVEVVETHMSWVFLTDRSVYKLKKPIVWDRLDFSTVERRRFCCEEEVRLNRRLAPAVYRGTRALTREPGGGLALDGRGRPVDWLVEMERLPADRMLDRRLAAAAIRVDEVRDAAGLLARFFADARPVPIGLDALRARFEAGIVEDRDALRRPEFDLPRARVDAIAERQLAFLRERPDLIVERIRAHRIVDGHGDLRPEHVGLTRPLPVVIDCLEFCAELRELDPFDELGFLALECERLGQPRIGPVFVEAYARASRDRIAPALAAFYRDHRILRRARLAAWHLTDPGTREPERFARRARHYLALAGPTPRRAGALGPMA